MRLYELAENTLGVVIGPRGSQGQAARGPVVPRRTALGSSFIGLGASFVSTVGVLYGFGWFVAQWGVYPRPFAALLSWVLLLLALVIGAIAARFTGEQMPTWMLIVFIALLAVSVALDLAAIWDLHNIGRYATSATAAGLVLLVVTTSRRGAEIVVADIVLGVALVAAVLLNVDLVAQPAVIAQQVTAIAFAVTPAAVAVFVVHHFRRMVQLELDRVLVQSTVNAPRFAVGMLASEELARLDLAAEELLDSVATGRTPLPLRPRTASVAASLATELRLHLIEGRRETWLYHAITESEMLGKSVSLVDKGSLAGLLDDRQRDGLLSAIWMLVSEKAKPSAQRTVEVQVGPIIPNPATGPGQKLTVPIVIATTGIARNRVDPSTWDALRRVGRYSDSTRESSVKIDVECLVDNPADVQA